MALVEYSEYKGHKLIVLKDGETSKFPIQFGLGKAKIILQHIDAIKKFVEDNDDELV